MDSILEVTYRSVLAFVLLLVLVRLMGKQQVSEMTFFDYVVGITIGSIASTLSVQINEPTLSTLLGMVIWAILPVLLAYCGLRSVWLRKVVEGEAVIVIANGAILEKNLKKIRISLDDLIAQLRLKEVFKISDVEFALFEANGRLSVLKKPAVQPITRSDFTVPLQYEGLPTNLVMDGAFLPDSLRVLNLTRAWLIYYLNQNGINDCTEITLAQLDTQGNLYIDFKDERPPLVIKTVQKFQ